MKNIVMWMNNYTFDMDENMDGCRLKIRWMWIKK